MKNVFEVREFEFPYEDVRFPGQASDERILYIAREALMMLYVRLLLLVAVVGVIVVGSLVLPDLLAGLGVEGWQWFGIVGLGLGLVFLAVGWWWVRVLWKRSVFVLTNRRLIKIINTTPWNRHNLSLALDSIIDTGAYSRGYFQAFFRIGRFTARSSAGNRDEKYFFVENIEQFEDFKNYVDKTLHVLRQNEERLENFRPFVTFLKGGARKSFMKKYPQFWS